MALLALWVSGCAGFQVNNSPNFDKDDPSMERRMLRVPFFPDTTDQCGPAALASVLSFWGVSVDPPALKEEIYLANLKGSLAIDLLLAAQNRGFKADLYSGSIVDLKSKLREGHPMVVFVNRGFHFFPVGHFVVVNGYDEPRQGLYVHSGASKNQFVSYKRFLKDWEKTKRSTLLIRPLGPERDPLHEKT